MLSPLDGSGHLNTGQHSLPEAEVRPGHSGGMPRDPGARGQSLFLGLNREGVCRGWYGQTIGGGRRSRTLIGPSLACRNRFASALQHSALEIGSYVDGKLLGCNVSLDIGCRDQLDLLTRHSPYDAASYLKVVGGDIAINNAALSNNEPTDVDIALDRALDLKIALS